MLRDFKARYPHGVLTEQEGGVPNDVYRWEDARHVCRKHKVTETVCVDTLPKRRPTWRPSSPVSGLPTSSSTVSQTARTQTSPVTPGKGMDIR